MTVQLLVLPVGLTSPALLQRLTQGAPHGRPGLGRLEQAKAVTSIIHTRRIFAPVSTVFDPKAGQGRRKSRRFLQLSVRPTPPSPVANWLVAVHTVSIHQAEAAPK